jgi:hypothetical protein
VTTCGGLDELVTPLEGCSATGADEGEVAVAVEVEVPGIVSALTTARPPTPANAPTATPAVRRFSLRSAASRAFALAWIGFLLSMLESLVLASKPDLGAALEQAGKVKVARK